MERQGVRPGGREAVTVMVMVMLMVVESMVVVWMGGWIGSVHKALVMVVPLVIQ
jgi:UPF0716 family protein affecting phage T7 exclusion